MINSVALVKLVYGRSNWPSRRLLPARAFGVRHQAARSAHTLQKICSSRSTCWRVREFNGESDHVHLLINYPPKVRLSELVNSLEGVSSRRLKQDFPAIKSFWSVRKSRGVLWSPSYFAGSVGGAPLSVLEQYIEQQARP